jgi:hypothetical protein
MEKYTYLKVKLKDTGITYQELGDKLNLCEASVSNKINHTREADFELGEFEKIFEVLGVTDAAEKCRLMNIKIAQAKITSGQA